MNGGLFVNTEEMDARGNDTIREGENLENQIRNLSSSVSELMTIWHGPAANSFNESVTNQLEELREFKSLIDQYGQNIVSGARKFSETETENANMAGKLF